MNKALQYALKLLGKKDYTEVELKRKFEQHDIRGVEVEEALLFLKSNRFIDDERFATQYQKSHPGRGSIRIRYELMKKGVEESIINEVIADLGSETRISNAREVAKSWLSKKRDKYDDKFKLKQHLIAKLGRQGFAYDDICQALEGLLE